jgi:glycosyltransferase involved in cell wall biosynthesis
LYRYSSEFEANKAAGYLREYPAAIAHQLRLALRIARHNHIDVVHACNPPDLLFLVALPLMLIWRARFLFDHHDVSPELLQAKGYGERSMLYRLTVALERLTFRFASVSIATNESYREVAIRRGRMKPDDVFVVRSGPDPERFADFPPDDAYRRGRRYLVGYVGVIGQQEGIDYLLEAVQHIVYALGRSDITFALAGSGPDLARVKQRAQALKVDTYVDFLGRIPDAELGAMLGAADLCVNPDEANRMNDISTMNKIMDYMSVAKPIVQFDLHEGRVSAGDASVYVAANDSEALGEAICDLLDRPDDRRRMGAEGRRRVETTLNWDSQKPALLAAYRRVLDKRSRRAISS